MGPTNEQGRKRRERREERERRKGEQEEEQEDRQLSVRRFALNNLNNNTKNFSQKKEIFN